MDGSAFIGSNFRFSKCIDNNPPTIPIPIPSDKKLVKLSKLIPAPASFCFKLHETMVDITVFVKESPPKTKIIIIVMSQGVLIFYVFLGGA